MRSSVTSQRKSVLKAPLSMLPNRLPSCFAQVLSHWNSSENWIAQSHRSFDPNMPKRTRRGFGTSIINPPQRSYCAMLTRTSLMFSKPHPRLLWLTSGSLNLRLSIDSKSSVYANRSTNMLGGYSSFFGAVTRPRSLISSANGSWKKGSEEL